MRYIGVAKFSNKGCLIVMGQDLSNQLDFFLILMEALLWLGLILHLIFIVEKL